MCVRRGKCRVPSDSHAANLHVRPFTSLALERARGLFHTRAAQVAASRRMPFLRYSVSAVLRYLAFRTSPIKMPEPPGGARARAGGKGQLVAAMFFAMRSAPDAAQPTEIPLVDSMHRFDESFAVRLAAQHTSPPHAANAALTPPTVPPPPPPSSLRALRDRALHCASATNSPA